MSGGVPYLGSKISLVSKSEIRYEGILYTIDTKESTVALAKVRSFGTEGRPTDRPVAPRDEIYEYIIFRASDIKDLHVSEPPKPQPTLTSGLPNDPAIVQHSAPVSAYSIPYGQASYGHVCSLPPFQHYPGQQSIPHMPQSFFTAGHLPGSRSATPAPLSQRKSPTSDAGVQVSGGISSDDEKSSRSRPSSPEQLKSKIRDRERDRETNQSGSAMAQQQRRQQPMRRQPQRGRGGPRRGRGRGRGLAASRTQEILKFDVEYDFEQANAEFQELEIKLAKTKLDDSGTETLAGGDTEDEAIGCYDREKSFFDNISCDASRSKSMPRFDWRIERKLNVETFGVSLSNAWRRRRGRGGFRRGFRSRGNVNRVVDTQKTVTFDTVEKVVTVEATADVPSDNAKVEIPTIELIVPKESDWEGSDTAKELWN